MRSVMGDRLCLANIDWLKRLSHGWMLVGVALGVLIPSALVVELFDKRGSFFDNRDPVWSPLSARILIVSCTLGLIAWVLLLSPEHLPGSRLPSPIISHRRMARIGGVLLYALHAGYAITGEWQQWYMLVLGLTFIPTCISAGIYFGRLGARGGATAIAWKCRWIGYGFSSLGLSMFALGVLVMIDFASLPDELHVAVAITFAVLGMGGVLISAISLLFAVWIAFDITLVMADALKQAQVGKQR